MLTKKTADLFSRMYGHKVLTRKEEIALLQEIKEGREKAREELILSNLKLVHYWAKKFYRKHNFAISLDDLIQYGILGLLEAVDKFDVERNTKFSTYASFWIRQKIDRNIKNLESTIRLPIYLHTEYQSLITIKEKKEAELSRSISQLEWAKEAGITLEELANYHKIGMKLDSLDMVYGHRNKYTLGEITPDTTESWDDIVYHWDNEAVITEALQILTKNQREIIEKTFLEGKTAREVAEEIGKNIRLVQNTKRMALLKLRSFFENRELFAKKLQKVKN